MRGSICLTALAIAVCLTLSACGGSQPHSSEPSRSTVAAAFKGSPPALSTLHDQAGQLLRGGADAFAARLRALRGHPVVVNEWASWCDPCRSEFPIFQRAAVKYGRRVAFLGIDARDKDSAARAFLKRFPVSYPSYADPSQSIDRALETIGGVPQTIYIDARGRHVYDHGGSYTTSASLDRDIRFYLLR